MPTIKRQTPPAKTQRLDFPEGSMLAAAIPVTELQEEFVKVCYYGRNRSGKTTIACEHEKPLLLISSEPDVCGGATSVSNKPGVFLQRISHKLLGQDKHGRWLDASDSRCVRRDKLKGPEKMLALVQELTSPGHPFKTVVLDTATSLQELVLVEIMGWDAPPAMHPNAKEVGKDNYQYRAEKWRKTMTPFLDLNTCDVITLCQEKDHNPPVDDFGGKRKILGTMQQGSFMAPALGSTNAQWLQDHCGYIIQIYEDEVKQEIEIPNIDHEGKPLPPSIQRVGTGKRQRHLRLLYHPNFCAGGRWQFDRGIPEFVTAPTPRELYMQVAKYISSLKV